MLDPSTQIHPEYVAGSLARADFPKLREDTARFGYVPDTGVLRPGDLILSSRLDANKGGMLIQAAQKQQGLQHTEWSHVGLYVGVNRWIDLFPDRNVQVGSVFDLVPEHKLHFRRPKIFTQSIEGAMLGLRMALEAALTKNLIQYSMKANRETGMAIMARTASNHYDQGDADRLNCSRFYARMFNIATGQAILPEHLQLNNEPITPALLADVSTLEDISVKWLQLR